MTRYNGFTIVFLVVLAAASAAAQTALQPETEQRETLTSRAEKAKAEGKTAVVFPSRGVSYPVAANGLTHAVSEFTVVVGIPRAMQTVIQDDAFVATWYLIAIDEVIANRPCQMCSLLNTDGLPKELQPTNLLPIPARSMLLLRRGGTVTLDGVAVTETENGVSALNAGKKYLFVVDKSSSGMARLVLNDAGIFSVDKNAETLTPIAETDHATAIASKPQTFPSLKELREAATEANKATVPGKPPKSSPRGND